MSQKKIFIPTKGAFKVISDDINAFETVIGCETTSGTSINYLDYFGYRLAVFFDDCFLSKDLPINLLTSMIVKEKGPFYGDCILTDDEKDLSLEDLIKIITIAKAIPSLNWIPEPIVDRADIEAVRTYVNRNPQEERLKIWNKVKEFYVL